MVLVVMQMMWTLLLSEFDPKQSYSTTFESVEGRGSRCHFDLRWRLPTWSNFPLSSIFGGDSMGELG